eukprot:2138054-Prymnesium_polylepis.2
MTASSQISTCWHRGPSTAMVSGSIGHFVAQSGGGGGEGGGANSGEDGGGEGGGLFFRPQEKPPNENLGTSKLRLRSKSKLVGDASTGGGGFTRLPRIGTLLQRCLISTWHLAHSALAPCKVGTAHERSFAQTPCREEGETIRKESHADTRRLVSSSGKARASMSSPHAVDAKERKLMQPLGQPANGAPPWRSAAVALRQSFKSRSASGTELLQSQRTLCFASSHSTPSHEETSGAPSTAEQASPQATSMSPGTNGITAVSLAITPLILLSRNKIRAGFC